MDFIEKGFIIIGIITFVLFLSEIVYAFTEHSDGNLGIWTFLWLIFSASVWTLITLVYLLIKFW